MASYTTQQQIALCFAYLAYTDELLTTGTPTLDAQIASDLNTALGSSSPITPIAGNWSLAWGPVSYTVPGALYQDNMMYVVQLTGATPPQYFVAVRGTNGAAELDWLLEDFDVLQQMPWPIGATGSDVVGQVSESTSIGMTVLLGMQDPATGDTLQQFLANQIAQLPSTTTSGSVPIVFTGHSLGAALASTLALSMLESQSSWDPNSYSAVSAITFAGPTAGNADFASYSDTTFGNSAGSVQRITTSQDIIPLFWNSTTMGQVTDIYTGHGIHDIHSPTVAAVMPTIISLVKSLGYTQIEASQAALSAPFIYQSNLPAGLNSDAYLAEAEYQHLYSYPCVLSVPSLLTSIVNAYEFGPGAACASNG